MKLTRHTDYALRVMLHLASVDGGKSSISEIAATHGISRNHLMKIIHQLGLGGFIRTLRGRGGGFVLARPAAEIRIGDVVRYSEPDMTPADCDHCAILPACGLSGILGKAVSAFMAVLDAHSLADAVHDRGALSALIATLGQLARMEETGPDAV